MLFFLNYLTKNQKIHQTELCYILSFTIIFDDILLAKTILILLICLAVRNNSCGNSSCSKFFLFILYDVPVFFLAADFHLFNSVFVNLTVTS